MIRKIFMVLLVTTLGLLACDNSETKPPPPITEESVTPAESELASEQIKEQRENYPTDMCVVSGDKLGSMGEPVERVVLGRLVKLCCNACIDSLEKNPVRFVEMIDKPLDANLLDQAENLGGEFDDPPTEDGDETDGPM